MINRKIRTMVFFGFSKEHHHQTEFGQRPEI